MRFNQLLRLGVGLCLSLSLLLFTFHLHRDESSVCFCGTVSDLFACFQKRFPASFWGIVSGICIVTSFLSPIGWFSCFLGVCAVGSAAFRVYVSVLVVLKWFIIDLFGFFVRPVFLTLFLVYFTFSAYNRLSFACNCHCSLCYTSVDLSRDF